MLLHLLCDGLVEGRELEELLVTQAGIDAGVDELYLVLHQRLVLWLAGPGRNDCSLVGVGKVLHGPVDVGLVAAGFGDGCLQVIGHQHLRHATELVQAAAQGIEEVGDALAPDSHGKAVVRVRQAGGEYLARYHLPGGGIGVGEFFSGKVDKKLFCRLVV